MVSWSGRGAVVALSLLLAACQQAREAAGTLGELNQLRNDLVTELGESNVGVNLQNDRHLTVSLVNSRLKDLPAEEKERKAEDIARIAYQGFRSREKLETVGVVFVVQRSFLVFTYTSTSDQYRYDVKKP